MKQTKFKSATAISLVLTVFLLINSGCTYAWKGIRGNGNVIKQDREISNFHGLEVGGAFHVFLTQGDKESLRIEADENLMDIIITRVKGGILEIETKEDIRESKALNIYITFNSLNHLDISGACNLEGENKFKLDDLNMECSGASQVMLKFAAENMDFDCSGACNLDLYGSAQSLNLDLSGASKFNAFDLQLAEADVDISGASHARLFVRTQMSAEVSGAGSLKYKGDAKLINHEVSGAGSIKKM